MAEAPRILLVAGLGNPGLKYRNTWHNLGFMVLDAWAASKKLEFSAGRGDYYRLTYKKSACTLHCIKPASYMNLSGVPIVRLAHYYRLAPENVLIICDDVALPLGTIRLRKSGSDGGHKGLASVIGQFGSENVPRMRVGFWTEGWRGELADHVLSAIPTALQEELKKLLPHCVEALDCVIEEGLDPAMSRFNRNFLMADKSVSPEDKLKVNLKNGEENKPK
jgi:peptidyl-tRNA hydrolase, PTH1 family